MILRALFLIARFLFVLFIVRLVLRMIFPVPTSKPQGRRPGPPSRVPERSGGALVRDPQCGTYVAQTSAHRVQSGSETLYFCSTACRDTWLAQQPASGARRA